MAKYYLINIKDISHYEKVTGHKLTKIKDNLYRSEQQINISLDELMKIDTSKCSTKGGYIIISKTSFDKPKTLSFRFSYTNNPEGNFQRNFLDK